MEWEEGSPAAGPEDLIRFLRANRPMALTGAGMSTDSGIPDYRGPRPAGASRPTPLRYQDFVREAANRRRYWARSTIGWPWLDRREPNGAHHALAALQTAGYIRGIVTQNVDSLHQKAGAIDVVELHGGLDRVFCLECRSVENRRHFQWRILFANPGWEDKVGEIAPDGDVHLAQEEEARFRVPPCEVCGGPLMPDVVFFGDSVPRRRVEQAFSLLGSARSLLVLGSSLTVFSGYRFALEAAQRGWPLAIVNDGPTRADGVEQLRLHARLGPTLGAAANQLAAVSARSVQG